MKEITLTINDKQAKGVEGNTVLEVCRANGVDLPTLCHLDGVSDVGACRMCVVEIQGERRPVPACTYPARDGLVVQTHTPELERYRRLILELIFTERNHYCMFCEKSGDCELQKLAYRYQMDSVRYPYTFPALKLDSLGEYVVIDHNRCILCGRCVRTCAEIEANFTLDFGKRGWKTLVSADLNRPLGESSCVSCGACVQACPTGAIFSKLSLYTGKTSECEQVSAVCTLCGVGCELNVLVKDNNLVRIESPSLPGNAGSLCRKGRFELLRNGRPRITSPLMRDGRGRLKPCTMDEALSAATEKLRGFKKSVAGIVSTKYPNETLSLFSKFMHEALESDWVDTLDGRYYRAISKGIKQLYDDGKELDIECSMGEILKADCILVVETDPAQTHPVIGSLIRRAVRQGSTRLIVVDPVKDSFPLSSTLWLKPEVGTEDVLFDGITKMFIDGRQIDAKKVPKDLAQSLNEYSVEGVSKTTGIPAQDLRSAAETYGKATNGIIIYGEELLKQSGPGFVNSLLVTSLVRLSDLKGKTADGRSRVISLKPSGNSLGAWRLGMAVKEIPRDQVKAAYVLLGEEEGNEDLLAWLQNIGCIVVQASHPSPVVSMADVVFPSPAWAERTAGEYVNMDGQTRRSGQALLPRNGLPQDAETLVELAEKMGHKLSMV